MRNTATFIFALLFCAIPAIGRQLTPAEALMRISSSPRSLSAYSTLSIDAEAPQLVETLTADSGSLNTVYIYRDAGGQTLFVAADDIVSEPLLGYSYAEESASAGELNPAMRWWLDSYSRQISKAINSGYSITTSATVAADRKQINTMIGTRWGQSAPYSDYCPVINGSHAPTGCVATVMSQVMNYHKWPQTGEGSSSYYLYTVGKTLSANYADSTFHWDLMDYLRITESSPKETIAAVASLMSAAGISVEMTYEHNSSGAVYRKAGSSLINYFRYDHGMRYIHRAYFGIEDWTDLLYNELAAGRPVLYGGANEEVAHAFICDGYRTDGYFHFNWGWNGNSDGYFLITELNPQTQGVGGSSGGYNENQLMFIGIKPEGTTTEQYVPTLEFMSDFEPLSDTISRASTPNVEFRDSRGISNESLFTMEMYLGVRLTDSEGNVSYISSATPKSFSEYSSVISYNIPQSEFPQSGTYTVEPVVRNSQSDQWYDNLVKIRNVRQQTLTCTPETLTFEPVDVATVVADSLKILSPLVNERDFALQARVRNLSDAEFYEPLYVTIEDNYQELAQGPEIQVNLLPDSTATFVWVGKFEKAIAAGTYKLFIIDASGKKISRGLTVTLVDNPSEEGTIDYEYYFGATRQQGPEESSPAEVSSNDFIVEVEITGKTGYFTDVLEAVIFQDTHGIQIIHHGFVGLLKGQTDTLYFRDNASWMKPSLVYNFRLSGKDRGIFTEPSYFVSTSSGIQSATRDASGLTLLPNPADSYTTLITSAEDPIKSVEIYSVNGRKLRSVNVGGSSENVLQLDGLAPGVYILRAVTVDGRSLLNRLIKR